MATRRSKPSLKSRPKYKQDRSLAKRRRKARLHANRKRARNRAAKKRQTRTNKPRKSRMR